MLQNINIKTRVRKKKRKIVRRLILLQLVLLAFASHYARAEILGIIKYYLIELFGVCCLVCILAYIKEKMTHKDKKIEVKPIEEKKQIIAYPRTYNFNWIIKSENKEEKIEVKEVESENENKKIEYKSPFEETINTDKKMSYRSPFEPLHNNVVLVLDSAKEDFEYKLRHIDKCKVFVKKKEKFKYRLRIYKDKSFVKKEEKFKYKLKKYSNKILFVKKEEFRYKLRKYNDCKLVKKDKVRSDRIKYSLCNFRPKLKSQENNDLFLKNEKEYTKDVFGIISEERKDEMNYSGDNNLLSKAIEMVLDYEQASVSFLQRKLNIGYLEALRLLDQMEEWGIVAKDDGGETRRILTTKQEWLDLNM